MYNYLKKQYNRNTPVTQIHTR